MGAVASSPCDKGSLVSDVKGITTRSASPSEQWFISIDSETLDSEPKSVFLKMFLSPNSNTKDLCDLTELPKRYNAISKDLTKVFNGHYRNGNKCCQNLLIDESYVDEMKWAYKEYMRKKRNEAFF